MKRHLKEIRGYLKIFATPGGMHWEVRYCDIHEEYIFLLRDTEG